MLRHDLDTNYDAKARTRLEASRCPEPNTGCSLWTEASVSRFGYGMIYYRGRQRLAHRVAWMLDHGPIPAGMCVLHRCDTPACSSVTHLFLGTKRDNSRDMAAKGRAGSQVHPDRVSRGSGRYNSKLDDASVCAIRQDHSNGVSRKALASRHGVSVATIYMIVTGRNWRHVHNAA